VFANVVLVDELNRASPKVQSAFLEVMQERQVTIENETMPVPSPFMVLATQIPFGEQGTYPLTSVQVDRFSYHVDLEAPGRDSEVRILGRVDEIEEMDGDVVLNTADVLELSRLARGVYVDESVRGYIVDLVQSVRRSPHVRMGPSPRASIWLFRGARVRALMEGRGHVVPDDVKGLVGSVIPHRVELTPQARAGEVTAMSLVEEALEKVAVPKGVE
jgi:MoxR-like ATPase